MSRVTRAPLIAHAEPGIRGVAFLDAKLHDDLGALLKEQGQAPFGLEILTTDDSEQRLIVSTYTSTQRRDYFVDRPARKHTLLAQDVPEDVERTLAPVRPVKIMSRDGLQLHGYLTLPLGVQPKRLPMVVLVHGGPWMRRAGSDR
jgi:dipeptidyl aminopeptidase/acylaminoacyl peptidase